MALPSAFEPVTGDFYGHPTLRLASPHLWLDVLTTAGPRIVRLGLVGSDQNLLAETPDLGWETPFGRYELFGGHRLWSAPEDAERSAVPDVEGLVVEVMPLGIRLRGQVEPSSGLTRSITLELHEATPTISVRHELCNSGTVTIELAPWAITQLPLGGSVILPQPRASVGHNVRPNRNLVLWPYTSWEDKRLGLHDGHVLVGATSGSDLKVGYFNDTGWVAYLRGETLFVRRFEPAIGRDHPDMVCNVETYVGSRYLELELLGPSKSLAPGESCVLTELWEAAHERHDELAILRRLTSVPDVREDIAPARPDPARPSD